MKEIPLTQGKVALVDDEDYEILCLLKWHVCKGMNTSTLYAWRAIAHRGPKIFMHRQIMSAPIGVQIDHIDRNGLNNQRSNLRFASPSQNSINRAVSTNTSGFRGVCWNKSSNTWQAQINVKRKQIYLGIYESITDAARAYDDAAVIHHGDFAVLNFPRGL